MSSGGAGKNDAVIQLLADATGMQMINTNFAEPVLLGATMVGAVASASALSLHREISAMGKVKSRLT